MAMMPEGDEIDITFNNDSLHVFDAAGQRTAAQG
jgi:sn-glycerol 3-phosphate transport system ATP-binding protein